MTTPKLGNWVDITFRRVKIEAGPNPGWIYIDAGYDVLMLYPGDSPAITVTPHAADGMEAQQ